jgi:hypothetical protein
VASNTTAVAVHAVGRGHGGVVELGKRRPLHEGAEDVGAVDDAGRLDTGESSDGCECVQGEPPKMAPLVRPGWLAVTNPADRRHGLAARPGLSSKKVS